MNDALMERQMVMRPLDVVIVLKKITPKGRLMNGKQLAGSLGISASEVSVAMERNRIARLVDETKTVVNILSLKDFLIYGIRYCFPVRPGRIVRGHPTASSADPIKSLVSSNGETFVWRDPSGSVRGQSLTPLYPGAVSAVKEDADFYSLLSIVDSLRIGGTRERQVAILELEKLLDHYALSNKL